MTGSDHDTTTGCDAPADDAAGDGAGSERRSKEIGRDTASGDLDATARDACEAGLAWARERGYAGWDPYDGLNSPYLAPFRRTWLTRLVGMHLPNRVPLNLHRPLRIPRERNPKGIALFALAHLARYEATGERARLEEAERLLDWLAAHSAPDFEYPCWGYNFDWQNARQFFLPAYRPSVVVSVFGALAFLEHYRLTGRGESLATARGTCEFLTTEINTRTVDGHEAYTYATDDSFVVVNVNALAARLLGPVGAAAGDDDLTARADELIAFVRATQEPSGAWHYSVPADSSPISHDNFHTGFVLESLREYLDATGSAETGERLGTENPELAATERAYERGLAFYREHLFEPDGAPKFEHDRSHPYDAHAAAQSIRTFVRDGRPEQREMARRIVRWSLSNLYDESGYFYRRRGRLLDDLTPYMRWSQAWMCFALASYLHSVGGGR
jgi:hypothetical protein